MVFARDSLASLRFGSRNQPAFTQRAVESTFEAEGVQAIDERFAHAPARAWRVHQLRLTLDAVGGAGDLVVSLDHDSGPEFDLVVLTQDMTAVQHLIWTPDNGAFSLTAGTALVVEWPNAGGVQYGLEILYTLA